MAYTVSIAPLAASAVIGATTNFTATTSGASIAYVWKRGSSVISGQTGKTITLTESTETSYTLNCEVTVSAPDYNNGTATKGIAVAFTKKTMSGVSVTLTPESITTEQGSEASFKANVIGAPEGASGVYSWTKDGSPVEGSTSTLVIDTSDIGSQVIGVSVEVSAEDYTPITVTTTGNVTITKRVAPAPDGELPYIHPLPFRGTAYIWCGWWVNG